MPKSPKLLERRLFQLCLDNLAVVFNGVLCDVRAYTVTVFTVAKYASGTGKTLPSP